MLLVAGVNLSSVQSKAGGWRIEGGRWSARISVGSWMKYRIQVNHWLNLTYKYVLSMPLLVKPPIHLPTVQKCHCFKDETGQEFVYTDFCYFRPWGRRSQRNSTTYKKTWRYTRFSCNKQLSWLCLSLAIAQPQAYPCKFGVYSLQILAPNLGPCCLQRNLLAMASNLLTSDGLHHTCDCLKPN